MSELARQPRLRRAARAALAALLAAALPSTAPADDAAPDAAVPAFANEVEASLVRAIFGLRESGLRQAIGEIDVALSKTPNFRLGHLIRGDLLMARAGIPVAFGQTASVRAGAAPLQDEARVRLKHYLDAPPRDHLPLPMLKLAPTQAHAILVDTSRSRLFVFANQGGEPRGAWEQQRTERIERPKSIEVLVKIQSIAVEGDSAVAVMRQSYRSDTLKTSSTKTLKLVKAGGKWLIKQERVGG